MASCRMPCCKPDRWQIVDVPADGNCFFHAVAGAAGADAAADLRQRVCDAAALPADHALRKAGEWFDTHVVPIETVAKVIGGPLAVRNQVEDTWQVAYPNGDLKFECIPDDARIIVAGGWHFMRVEAMPAEEPAEPEEPPPPAYEDALASTKTAATTRPPSVMPLPVPARVPRPPKRPAAEPAQPASVAGVNMALVLFFIVAVLVVGAHHMHRRETGARARHLARRLQFF